MSEIFQPGYCQGLSGPWPEEPRRTAQALPRHHAKWVVHFCHREAAGLAHIEVEHLRNPRETNMCTASFPIQRNAELMHCISEDLRDAVI